jgi:hypothetical protein
MFDLIEYKDTNYFFSFLYPHLNNSNKIKDATPKMITIDTMKDVVSTIYAVVMFMMFLITLQMYNKKFN